MLLTFVLMCSNANTFSCGHLFQTIPVYVFSESYGGKMAAAFSKVLYQVRVYQYYNNVGTCIIINQLSIIA